MDQFQIDKSCSLLLSSSSSPTGFTHLLLLMEESEQIDAPDLTQVEDHQHNQQPQGPQPRVQEPRKTFSKPKGKSSSIRKGKLQKIIITEDGKKRTSPVWEDFSLPVLDKPSGKERTSCFHCGKTYLVNIADHGTSTLITHTRRCKKHPKYLEAQKQSKLIFKRDFNGSESSLTSWSFDQALARKALVKMLILNELPFRFVESEGFKKFLEAVCPMFIIPSRATVNRDMTSIFLYEKNNLKEFFDLHKPRVCLTTDTWTSVQQINYMCLTLHFIDQDWELKKKIINFCLISSHKGEDLGKYVEKCLIEWGITSVLTVTVDNASSNDTAMLYIRKKFNQCSSRSGVLDGRFMHMRCIAHIINLIVNDGIAFVGKSVEKIRACVRFIRQSPQRITKFKHCASLKKISSKSFLCLDVPTRWNSTFLMLKSACVYESVFEMYIDEDYALKNDLNTRTMKGSDEILGVITDEDWIEVKRVMNFLSHFYDLTVRVSGSSYITSNTILDEISDTFTILKTNAGADTDLSAMCLKMQQKFDKYWGDISKINLFIFIARIFDPRGKMLLVKYVIGVMYPDKSDALCALVEKALTDLFDEYVKLYPVPNPLGGEVLSQPSSSLVGDKAPPQRGLLAAQFLQFQCNTESPKSELDKYLKEGLEAPSSSFSILQWWKQNSQRFPIMSRMARDFLAIPISTVSSESAFSTGGRVLSDYRSCLLPTTVECLICLQDWIRNSPPKELEFEETLYEVEATDEEVKTILEGKEDLNNK